MNLTDVLEDLGVEYARAGESPHVTEGWVGIRCPWCDGGRGNFGLGIHQTYLNCTCWSCGPHSLKTALREATKAPWDRINALLRGVEQPERLERPRRGRLDFPKGVGPLKPAHRRYLKSRGFDPDELARLWGLLGTGLHPRLPWRIVIPAHFRGEVVSWTTRALHDSGLRYISARPDQEVMGLKEILYGWDYVRHAAVVCEGPADVWRLGPGAVATFGQVWTTAQVCLLARVPRVTVCFDNEPEAQRRAARLAETLAPYGGRVRVVRLDSPDPGSATADEVRCVREKFLGPA